MKREILLAFLTDARKKDVKILLSTLDGHFVNVGDGDGKMVTVVQLDEPTECKVMARKQRVNKGQFQWEKALISCRIS
jgi:hypothetical protein